jgi:glycosyltransferase involved in cell wall biosynthesis
MVLHLITGLEMGGAERALYGLVAGGLLEFGSLVVLSLRDEGVYGPRFRELGVPVHTLGMSRGMPKTNDIIRLTKLVRSVKPDVIQGWMYHGNLAASIAAVFAPGKPAVAWNVRQSMYDLASEKRMTRQVIRANRFLSPRADALLYNSQLSRTQHEAFGFASRRGRVIPNGFDLEALEPNLSIRESVRKTLGVSRDELIVGHVARFHPMKDHASYLRAAVIVAERNADVRFVLVGRDVSLDNSALSGIVPPHLAGRFICMGERSDVYRLMQAFDVFCQSSWSEAFPNVLGEVMASGVPCVATDVGDSACIVGDTGRMVPPINPSALAEAVIALLSIPKSGRVALGRAARKRIESRYNLSAIVSSYADLYGKLIFKKN